MLRIAARKNNIWRKNFGYDHRYVTLLDIKELVFKLETEISHLELGRSNMAALTAPPTPLDLYKHSIWHIEKNSKNQTDRPIIHLEPRAPRTQLICATNFIQKILLRI